MCKVTHCVSNYGVHCGKFLLMQATNMRYVGEWGCVWFRTNLVNGRIAFQPRIDFSPQSQGWQIINGKHVSTFFNNAQLTVFLFVEHCQSSSLQCTNITINQWQWIGTMILWHIHDKALSQVKNHKILLLWLFSVL